MQKPLLELVSVYKPIQVKFSHLPLSLKCLAVVEALDINILLGISRINQLLRLTATLLPPQKLIRLCALPGSKSEKDEAQFLLVVCSRIKQDPHTLRYVLEVKEVLEKPTEVFESF